MNKDDEFKEKLRMARVQLISDGMTIRDLAKKFYREDPEMWAKALEDLENLEDQFEKHFSTKAN